MRKLPALALSLGLLVASPAFAQTPPTIEFDEAVRRAIEQNPRSHEHDARRLARVRRRRDAASESVCLLGKRGHAGTLARTMGDDRSGARSD